MKISLLEIGKTRSRELDVLVIEYVKRIGRFASFQEVVLKDPIRSRSASPGEVLKAESEMLMRYFKDSDFVVLLDEKGARMNSRAFAEQIGQWQMRGIQQVIFVVGGAYGFDPSIKDRANALLSLSDMTFSHQLIRLLFAEQLYRAMTILNNHPYHND